MSTLSFSCLAAKEGSISQYRHSVVCVQVGLQGEGGFCLLSGGTGFFIGEEGKDPKFLLTNHHVIEYFINFGKGQLTTMSIDEFMWTMWEVTRDDLSQDGWEYIVGIWTSFMGNNESGNLHSKILVYYDDKDYEEAYLVDSDSTKDMALLHLDKPTNKRTPLTVATPTDDLVGETVYAIGFPAIAENEYLEAINKKGETDASVVKGTLSRLLTETGTGRAALQADINIYHGNSGGPLLLEDGTAIGITSWGVSNWENEEVNYALSMAEVIPMLNRNDVAYSTNPTPGQQIKRDDTDDRDKSNTNQKDDSSDHGNSNINQKEDPVDLKVVFAIIGAVVAAAVVGVIVVLKVRKPKPQPQPQPIHTPTPTAPPSPVRPSKPQNANDSGFRIQSLGGTLGNRRLMIPTNGALILGRNPDTSNIVFPGSTPGISGRHCSIWYDNGSICLKDLGSTHGTFIEPGQRLAGEQTIILHVGQTFWLGSERERFTIARKQN